MMSMIRFRVAIASVVVLCGLSTAHAQKVIPGETRIVEPGRVHPRSEQPSAAQPGIVQPGSVQPGIVQPGSVQPGPVQQGTLQQGTAQPRSAQPSTTQSGQRDILPNGSQSNPGERYEARRVATDGSENGPTVKEAIVKKLLKGNEAEIEIAKMAMEKTDNQEIKKLCEMIVKDHQACIQKLQELKGQNNQNSQSNQAGNFTATVPEELCKISEQACENALKMTKEMLGKYEGQNFNMAFLGQQCVAHIMMLAELKAIESVGPKELNEVAKDGISKTEKHLEKCLQLAKKLESDEKKS